MMIYTASLRNNGSQTRNANYCADALSTLDWRQKPRGNVRASINSITHFPYVLNGLLASFLTAKVTAQSCCQYSTGMLKSRCGLGLETQKSGLGLDLVVSVSVSWMLRSRTRSA